MPRKNGAQWVCRLNSGGTIACRFPVEEAGGIGKRGGGEEVVRLGIRWAQWGLEISKKGQFLKGGEK